MHTRNLAAKLAVLGVLALTTALPAQTFDILLRVDSVKGVCQIKIPGAKAFAPVVKGKAYPFGTSVRTGKDGEAFILLSSDDSLRMSALCELTVSGLEDAKAGGSRTVRLDAGKLDVSVREGLPDQALTVETSVAACDSFAGRSTLELQKTGKPAKDKLDLCLLVHTDNGAVRVFGPQFSVPKMRPGSAVRVESTADRSVTRIVNESNEVPVEIDNGTDTPVALETSVHSTIRICREHAPVGGKLAVSVLEIAPDGKLKGYIPFVVGEPTLNSSGLQTLPDDRSAGGGTAMVAVTATNAPAKAESMFK